ncbi:MULTISPECIES: Na+/H+ antiporter NhaC family protein [Gammaproteobacteria]|uniref:Na+/H+ antiporter NhaC family protein n=1 Tax=Gammaproteobacteria TaxID=1236 RepID=UPI000DCF8914|nr:MULTISPECIES: Na+/H+ antiporter NhaC family protein [Gammaproteobacteria]RTE86186.1 sodium:proton antiporter [Aliidiomarina sp. B3213]TCZ91538.1 sodium:proton antiporter [Lysobacter sp. N42]
MSTELGWLSLLPSLLAIFVAIATRRVIIALLGGVLLAHYLWLEYDAVAGAVSAALSLHEKLLDPGNILIWGFTLAIGALFGVLEQGGTFQHFVQALENKKWVHSPRRARLFTWILGVVTFIESNVSIMTSGTTSRPIYDRLGMSRQKLAYIIDSTCAPVCILIPLNAWGAFNLGLIGQQNIENPLTTLAVSVVLNAYAVFALFLALWVAWSGWNFGPMKKYEVAAKRAHVESQIAQTANSVVNKRATITVIASLALMVLMVPIMLFVTGEGSFVEGDGMLSVFTAIYIALAIAIVGTFISFPKSANKIAYGIGHGVIKILPLAVILWLAIALGDITRTLGAGQYLTQLINESLPVYLLPALVFILSAVTAFAIGSSWGTFALMLPLAIPLALGLGMPVPLLIGAALAGGIFGDHASPISDTTIIASLASGAEHISHVRTQLPYAMLAAGMTIVFYLIAGFFVQWQGLNPG